jgi:8-oxo-dGTP pyrophosphatase MutT (NUDIX family)
MNDQQCDALLDELAALDRSATNREVSLQIAMLREFMSQTPTPWRSQPTSSDAHAPHPRGHITASAWVLDSAHAHAALLHHKKLNLWLQPGGQVEESDASWMDAALREVREETGLQRLHLTQRWGDRLFDVDVHAIPARPANNDRAAESAHHHFDLRFVFVADANESLSVNHDESAALKWFPLQAIIDDATLDASVRRMARMVVDSRSNFY